jgi:hypothetical protein
MKFHIVLLFLLLILVLSSYITFRMEIIVSDNDRFQGIQIRFGLPLYRFEQIYDYADPRLSLFEALLVDRWERSVGQRRDWTWKHITDIFKISKQIHLLSDWEQQTFYIFKRALGYMVVKDMIWKSRVGGRNAMLVALHTGLMWSIKGLTVTCLSNISSLKKVQLVVEPDYMSADFISQIDCILKMRIVHIITIAFYLIVWKVRWWINGFAADTRQQPSY